MTPASAASHPAPRRTASSAGIDRRSLAQQVCDRIKAEILGGRLPPGSRIAEERVVARLAVSRTPVREALRKLAAYGLVTIKPRSWVEVVRLDDRDVEEVLELRAELEALVVRHACGRLSAAVVAELKTLQETAGRALAAGDVAAVFTADSDWHLALARASGHRTALALLEQMDARVQLARMRRCTAAAQVAADVAMHDRILAALVRGDARRAEACMRRHIRRP